MNLHYRPVGVRDVPPDHIPEEAAAQRLGLEVRELRQRCARFALKVDTGRYYYPLHVLEIEAARLGVRTHRLGTEGHELIRYGRENGQHA